MTTKKRATIATAFIVAFSVCVGISCDDRPTTDDKQAQAQAQALAQAHAQIGMPAISDFHEKRMLKDLYELRDKPLPTHSYIVNEMRGCLVYLGTSIGYGLPYSTQYTSPTRTEGTSCQCGYRQIPQAEPNGLFMPNAAEGTWIMLKGPDGDVKPVYVEPRVVVSPFRLEAQECKSESKADSTTATTAATKK